MTQAHSPSRRQKVLAWGALGVSAAALFYAEIVLVAGMRYAATYFRAHILIAIALLSLLCGGFIIARARYEDARRLYRFALYALPVLPIFGFWGIYFGSAPLLASIPLFVAAFLPVAVIIAYAWRIMPPHQAYAIELFGALIGFSAALSALTYWREEAALFGLGVFLAACAVGAAIMASEILRVRLFLGAVLISALFIFWLQSAHDYFNLASILPCRESADQASHKIFCRREREPSFRIVRSHGSVVDRIDVVDFGKGYYGTSFAGDATDSIRPRPSEDYAGDARVPAGIISRPKTLILGAALEGVIKAVQSAGATDITAVDINPAITRLIRDSEISSYMKNPFAGARLVTMDARTYLERSTDAYDLITMMNTHRIRDIATFGEPDFLHTEEAFSLIFRHLTQNGIFSFEEKNTGAAAEAPTLRIIRTAAAAMRESGFGDPENHMAVYAWPKPFRGVAPLQYIQVAIKKSPWTDHEIDLLRAWAHRSADLLDDQRGISAAGFPFHRWLYLPRSNDNDPLIAAAVETRERHDILRDDSPFPAPAPLRSADLWAGLAIMGGSLTGALAMFWRIRAPGAVGARLYAYSAFIGFGYLAAEVIVIQKAQLATGSIPLGLVIGIGGLLAGSAAGGYVRHGNPPGRLQLAGIILLIGMFALAPPRLLGITEYPGLTGVIFASAAFALGYVMGPWLPYGAAHAGLRRGGESDIPFLIGINGTAGGLAIPAALLAASLQGYRMVSALAVAMFIAAWFIIARGRHSGVDN